MRRVPVSSLDPTNRSFGTINRITSKRCDSFDASGPLADVLGPPVAISWQSSVGSPCRSGKKRVPKVGMA